MSIIISLLAFVVSIFKPNGDAESTHGELFPESCPECNAPVGKMHATKCPRHPDNYDEFINNQEDQTMNVDEKNQAPKYLAWLNEQISKGEDFDFTDHQDYNPINKEKEDMNNNKLYREVDTDFDCTVLKKKGGQCTINGGFIVTPDADGVERLVCHLHMNLIVNKNFKARFTGAWIDPTKEKKEEEVEMGPIAQAWVTGEHPNMEAEEWILPSEARSNFVPAELLERMLVTFIRRSPANPNVFRKVGQIKKSAVPNTTEVLRMLKIENLRSARTRIAGFYFLNENNNTPTHVLVKCESRSWAFAISFVDGKVFLSKVTKEFKAMKKEGKLIIN